MPYPNRTAVLNTDNPDIQVIYRLLVPSEGVPPGTTGDTADGVRFSPSTNGYSRKSGALSDLISITVTADPPNLAGVAGLSQNGWGIANYIGGPSAATQLGMSVVWTEGAIITTYGGPVREPPPLGAPFGLWLFSAAINDTELPAFEGGTVTFTPTFDDIFVDWSFDSASFDTDPGTVTFFMGFGEAPLSSAIRPASIQLWRFNLPIDPLDLSNKMYGLETAYEASTLEINMNILFDIPVDDVLDLPEYTHSGSVYSKTDPEDNWMLGFLSSGDTEDTLTVLTRFSWNRPMFLSPGVPGPANFNHYTPVIATDAGNIMFTDGPYSVTDGWLMQGQVNELSPRQWFLISPDWSTYSRMSFIGGEQAFCDATAAGYGIVYTQDVDGTWLALTANISTTPNPTDYNMWVEGELASGFTGCTGSLSVIPPAPTAVTGDVTVRAWPLSLDGHDIYVLRLGLDITLLYDKSSKQWFQWSSASNAVWAINTGFEWLGGVGIGATNIIVGDDTTGTLYFLDPLQPYDNPQTAEAPDQQIYFDRIVMGQFPMTGREALPCYAIFVTSDMGDPAYDGASVTLYTSDDAGVTWDDHGAIEITVSVQPELLWASLGQITAPGRLFMLIDDGALTRIDSMEMNDPDDA